VAVDPAKKLPDGPTERLHRLGEEIGMRLVLTLEQHGEIEHRLLQKAAVRRELIGCHRSELASPIFPISAARLPSTSGFYREKRGRERMDKGMTRVSPQFCWGFQRSRNGINHAGGG
jgi:hypothetical protein